MAINNAGSYKHHPRIQSDEKLTVLIVDDSKVIRLALNKILRNDFMVLQANDGEDAWEKLEQNDNISMVFSDVSMPVLDGFGLLERVRTSTDQQIASLPFIIITANDDDPDFTSKVSKAGGNDLITKPFKTNEIMACIDRQIATSAPENETYESSDQQTEIMSSNEVADMLGLETDSQAIQTFPVDEIPLETRSDLLDSSVNTVAREPESLDELPELPIVNSPAVETPVDQYNSNNVEFTIDEDFFNETNDLSQPDENTHTEVTPAPTPSFDIEILDEEFSLDEELTQADDFPRELTLEPKHAPIVDEVVAEPIDEVAPVTSKKTELEIARKRANEMAKEKVAAVQSGDSAENARNATERSQIRAELLRLREKEINNGSYSQDFEYPTTGKMSSFFSGLMCIIKKYLGIS